MDDFSPLVRHYEGCLHQFGDSARGNDWPNETDAQTRYQVMAELFQSTPSPTVLDLGCGTGRFLDYLRTTPFAGRYTGVDVSPRFVEAALRKHPRADFRTLDLLAGEALETFDFVVMNGLFTERVGLSLSAMNRFFEAMLAAAFARCRVGVAFNVMSKHVDWEREDLFHLSFDGVASLVQKRLSRNFVFRNDYGLYEFTTYVFR